MESRCRMLGCCLALINDIHFINSYTELIPGLLGTVARMALYIDMPSWALKTPQQP